MPIYEYLLSYYNRMLHVLYLLLAVLALVAVIAVIKRVAFRIRINTGDYYQQAEKLYSSIKRWVPEIYLAQNVILRTIDGRHYCFEAVAVTGNGIYLVTIKHLPGPIKIHQKKGWSVAVDGWWEVFDCPGAYISKHFLRSYLHVNGIDERMPINAITIVTTGHHVPSQKRTKYADGDIRIYRPYDLKSILKAKGTMPKERRIEIARVLKEAGCTADELKQNPNLKFNPGIERWRAPYLRRFKNGDRRMGIVMNNGKVYWDQVGQPIVQRYDWHNIDYFIIHGQKYKPSAPMTIFTDDGNKYEYFEGMTRDDLPFPSEDVIHGYDHKYNDIYTEEYGEFYEN